MKMRKKHVFCENRIYKILLSVLLIYVVLSSRMEIAYASEVQSAHSEELETAMIQILEWQCEQYKVGNVQELVDIKYAEDVLSGVVQSYILGISGYEEAFAGCDFTQYTQALQSALQEGMQGTRNLSPVTYQKAVMVLASLGEENPVSAQFLYGTVGEKGIMSYCYGLLMLDSIQTDDSGDEIRVEIIDILLAEQLPDGGFTISGEQGDVDVTAMVLQALAPYVKGEGSWESISQKVSEAVERALLFLSHQQLPEGDFVGYDKVPTAESTVQVILALCALDVDPFTDPAFIRDGHTVYDGLMKYRNNDGSFSHTLGGITNDMATSQAFNALAALWRYEMGECFLFDFDSYERDKYEALNAKQIIPGTAGTKTQNQYGGWEGRNPDYRWMVTGVILAGCVVYLVMVAMQGRMSRKRVCSTVIVAGAVLVIVWLVRIQSKDAYLSEERIGNSAETIQVSMEIRCDKVAGEKEYIPEDGQILPATQITVEEGATVFDALKEAVRVYDIQLEYTGGSTSGAFAYVEGIAYLYEFDFGDLSGWMYQVNGMFADVGCGEYALEDGDEILWVYTLEMGKDVECHGEN